MAINNKTGVTEFVQCLNCKHATAYYQWYQNPVIAQCAIHGDRQVAQTKRVCKTFVERYEAPVIQHFDHYEGEDNE